MTEPDPLAQYIEAHHGRFTREAINAELLRAGHSQLSIDAAWAARDEQSETAQAARRMPGIGTVLLVLIVIAGYGFAAYLAFVFTLPDTYLGVEGSAATVLLTYAAVMVIACVYSVVRLLRAPSKGGGARAIGVAFAISVAAFIGLSGLCIAGLSIAS